VKGLKDGDAMSLLKSQIHSHSMQGSIHIVNYCTKLTLLYLQEPRT
jgi:hypothetical protein